MYNRLSDNVSSDKVAASENKTETTDLSSSAISESYGSTEVKDKPVSGFYVPFWGMVFYILAFFGMFFETFLRTGLSVAIVAMVNHTTVTESTNVSDNDQCSKPSEHQHTAGEFNWTRMQQGILLAAFYYGFVVTPIPGGWLGDRFGGKWLYGGCIFVSSVVALLTPTAARIHIGLLIALYVLSGLGEGAMVPVRQTMIARWSAPKYHSTVTNAISDGLDTGLVVGMFLAGVLCDYGFAGGWPSVFYVFGMIGCVWAILWSLLCYNSPSTHPLISTVEREYWQRTIGAAVKAERVPTPFRKIFTSAPVWALAIAFFAVNWSSITISTCLPLYLHDILGVDMIANGTISAVSLSASVIFTPIVGFAADWLRAPGRLSTNVVRKTFCVVGFVLSGVFIILFGYTDCNVVLAVAVIFIYMIFGDIGTSTVIANQLDLAPVHAGTIMGLSCTAGNIAAIGAPLAVGAMTSQATLTEWQSVFYLAAAVYAFGAVVYLIFGSGNRQSWAD